MNLAKLRTERVILPAIAAVAALGIGGVVWASTANANPFGGERNRVSATPTEAVGGGNVVEAESSDDPGEAHALGEETDDGDDRDEADDRALSAAERKSAEEAALEAVGGGTVSDAEAGDDRGEAYEVEVRTSNGTEWDVTLDSDFAVLDKVAED